MKREGHTEGPRDSLARTLGDLLRANETRSRPSETEWQELVRAVAGGDQRALQALHDRTHRAVYTLSVRITGNRETAEEVTKTVSLYRRLLRGEVSGGDLWRQLKLQNQLGVTRGQMERPENRP